MTAAAQVTPAGETPAPGWASPPSGSQKPAELLPSSPIIPIAELERRAILHALDYTGGDRAVAAHLLGIGRTTLYKEAQRI